MSVGVLLMTHEAVGQALISAAHHVMPNLPLRVTAVEVPPESDPEVMRTLTAHHARDLDQGDGVLILADLYGATPCNIGLSLGALGVRIRCVSGLNLPMLLRVLNYAEKPLDELAEIAASGGRGGILIDHA
ncbi:MAG: PTS fructose IIA subunit family protein [Rhodanobacter sp.]|nr:MAG: PTS fructose IIA subunit family protein [Rhodanobacter sp.]TAL93493.1 MAG: PTS fructose IIA subunit family protein [Rhodanobacter sp.]TAM39261.1 MAG: PTS fructose IIA subunit family protein [Rhodanobacter sp.]TAN28747.1 MAG: PTS fructose IIA subunit family protein [Rhodanobacter sp.]